MRVSCLTAVAAVLLPLSVLPPPALAQQPIRVVRHTPADTVHSGDVITISFDRPVAGSIERSGNPTRFVRIEPAFAAMVQWRDPVTLRVIPTEVLAPDRRYRLTVDTNLTALDGGRLQAPYQFTVATRGPRLLGSVPPLGVDFTPALNPQGAITLIYSAAVDEAPLNAVTRFEVSGERGCSPGVIRYAVQTQRVLTDTDDYGVRALGGWPDDYESRSRRMVVLRPQSTIPEGCVGRLALPSMDPADRSEILYRTSSSERFRVAALACETEDCVETGTLELRFTAPVHRDSLVGRVHLDPPTPFTIDDADRTSPAWMLRLALRPRTTYRVRVDTAVRDVFGRTLTLPDTALIAIRDRPSALGHQLGFITVSRLHPVIRLTHVNIDSTEINIVPIPDSLRAALLGALDNPDSVARAVGRLRDTAKLVVHLTNQANVERITEIPIPSKLLARHSGWLFAIRARATGSPPAPADSLIHIRGAGPPRTLPTIRIAATGEALSDRVALVQVTDLAAHATIAGQSGAVFVTDINTGAAIARASVTVRDWQGRPMSSGATDTNGVATMRASPDWHSVAQQTSDDGWNYGYWSAAPEGWSGRAIVDVVRADDRSVIVIGQGDYYEQVAYETARGRSAYDAQPIRAMVHTDRAIYRPGEEVYLGAIARQGWLGELKRLPAGDSIRLRVAAISEGPAEPDLVRDTVLRLTAYGTVADSFMLADAVSLGEYRVRLDVMSSGGWWPRAVAAFRVAEYRAPQFRASLDLDTTVRFLGDTISGRARASYYFGAPMARAVVRWSASTVSAPGAVEIPGLPERFTVASTYDYSGNTVRGGGTTSGIDTLDAGGTLDLRLPSARGTLVGPGRLDVEIAVEDLDRQTVVAEQSTVLHSSTFYIALRDSGASWYWRQGQKRTVDVFTVRPDGRRLADVRLAIAIVRHHVTLVTRANPGDPAWRWVSDTIALDSIATTDSTARFHFTPSHDGAYEVVFSARDERDRPVTTSVGGYVIPPRWASAWGITPDALAMHLARDTVSSGDSAMVSFVSPFERAEAVVTVEREGILAQYRRTVRAGETTIAIPVSDRFIPEATIDVLLVNAEPIWQTDSLHQRLRTGEVSLVVDRSSKALSVEIRPSATRYAPGDSVRVTLRLGDHRARPVSGEVTVWAVDESVLALTDSTRLDPVDTMYASRPTSLKFASTAYSIAALGRQLRPVGWMKDLAIYGAAALNAAVVTGTRAGVVNADIVPRTAFRTTAFYVAHLVTDANGVVTMAAKLPDNVTTYRIIAVAVAGDDRFGAAELPLVVTKPLIARSALPRFVRTGDDFTAGTVITNQAGAALATVVSASAKAIQPQKQDAASRTLPNGASTEVRFHWRVSAEPGDTALFRFAVSGGASADAVETPLPVEPPYSLRFHAMAGVARGDEVVRMMLPSNIDPVRSRLTLRVGTTPLPAIRSAYDRLRVYPYLCTEQLTSTSAGIVAMLRLQRAGLVDSLVEPTAVTLRSRLQFVVDEITRRQRDDGAIGYWTRSSWTTPPLSGYAGAVFLDARDLGLKVRPIAVARMVEYMQTSLENSRTLPDSVFGNASERRRVVAGRLASRLAALHFMRRAGFADTVRENELVQLEARLAWEDRVRLAELFAARTDPLAARRLLQSVWRDVELAGTRVTVPDSLLETFGFRSHVRPIARLVIATMAIDRDYPRLAQLVETIVQQGRARDAWSWNTQDYAALAEALTRVALWQRTTSSSAELLVRSARGGAGARVVLRRRNDRSGDTTVSLQGLVERDGEWTALPLRIVSAGTPVFYTLTVDEVPLDRPVTPDAKGIVVERWYERFDDGRPATEVKEGELVRARLRITVPADREFVAVADQLPAGLEVVDLSLRTSGSLGPFTTEGSEAAEQAGNRANPTTNHYYGSWYGGWWSPWEHHEIRDDRVVYFARTLWKGTYTASYVARATTAGTFVRPPAHAEEMYNESLGGRSDGGVFRIVPK